MNIVIEGPDRVGKDSLIAGIKSTFEDKHFIEIPSRAIKFKDPSTAYQYYFGYYSRLLSIMEQHDNLIFNRSHLGEMVYGKLYRDYDPSYIYDLEMKTCLGNTCLILLTCDPVILASRDDGLSFTNDPEKIAQELALFSEAFEASLIPHKVKIDCTHKSITDVKSDIISYLEFLGL